MSGIQWKNAKIATILSHLKFWGSMGNKKLNWLGTLGIWDFSLSENLKECEVASMCQCLREYLVKICLSLKMGSEQVSQSGESLDAQWKTVIARERDSERFDSLEQFNCLSTCCCNYFV